jgi:hypothetical protein
MGRKTKIIFMKQQIFKNWTTTLSSYDLIDRYDFWMNYLKGTKPMLSSLDKGAAFEKYTISKFSEKYYEILECRSDKCFGERQPKTNKLPDFVLQLQTHSGTAELAVECKWRKNFYYGKIVFKSYQLANYRKYEKEMKIPVFVIVGVGGEPCNPQSVYVIPLHEISSAELTQAQLSKYKKDKTENFFLNPQSMVLK